MTNSTFKSLKYTSAACLFICVFRLGLSAQDVVPISAGGTLDDMTCVEFITLTDSDADNGNYQPQETFTTTLCVAATAETFAQFIISPELFGHEWDVDANSSLFVYDGPTADPLNLVGEYNSVSHPSGVNVTASGNCLTFTFVSGPGSSGIGFTSAFQCINPFQPFNLDVAGTPNLSPWGDLPYPSIRICLTDSIGAQAITSYPLSDAGGNGYEQSDETTLFRWIMGDGTNFQGFGLTEISYVYPNPGGYQVTLVATDAGGRQEISRFFVLIAPRPDFSNVAINDTLCSNTETSISGGLSGGEFVGVDPSTSAIQGGGEFGEPLFLPDGNDNVYETSIEITDFFDGQVVESASDISSFCVNMEHSWLGDLEMSLTCPDGTEVVIFDSHNGGTGLFPGGCAGGGTFLGDPNESAPVVQGIGFDYCFAETAVWGTICEELANGNTVPVNTFVNGNAMAPGTYTPLGAFEQFIGCPLNGDWTLKVKDNLSSDDGWIFSWAIYFNATINPTTIFYSPAIDSVYWEDNVDIVQNSGDAITVQPSAPGDNDFTFVAIDEFGCIHDTTIFIYVRPEVVAADALACDLTHELSMQNAPAGGNWQIVSGPTENSTATFEDQPFGFADVQVNDHGIYEFLFTDNNCGYQDSAEIDFRPDPQIQGFVEDTVLCNNASIQFDAGPQFPNSQNFIVSWTLNDAPLNGTDLSVVADQTGRYILTLEGHCATVSDTSDVVAITIEFDGDTLCGLTYPSLQASIDPPGTGRWSSPDAELSFSVPDGLLTSVSSTAYGVFDLVFTDDRCPNDSELGAIRFVQQPEVTLSPANPMFCVDEDVLQMNASVVGDFSGVYVWSVNDEPQTINVGEITFEPGTFDPLVLHTIEARASDNFGVCPVAVGTVAFDGVWCNYDIPNVFTPNGDGRNDTWSINNVEFFPGAHLRIFNRWGRIVFDQEDFDQYQQRRNGRGWDAEGFSEGTYFYELMLPSVQKVESGNVTLLKGE